MNSFHFVENKVRKKISENTLSFTYASSIICRWELKHPFVQKNARFFVLLMEFPFNVQTFFFIFNYFLHPFRLFLWWILDEKIWIEWMRAGKIFSLNFWCFSEAAGVFLMFFGWLRTKTFEMFSIRTNLDLHMFHFRD